MQNARFRAVTNAYGALRGRSARSRPRTAEWDYYETRDEAMRAELRRRARRSEFASSSSTTTAPETDDSEVRYTIMAFVLVGVSFHFFDTLNMIYDLEPSNPRLEPLSRWSWR